MISQDSDACVFQLCCNEFEAGDEVEASCSPKLLPESEHWPLDLRMKLASESAKTQPSMLSANTSLPWFFLPKVGELGVRAKTTTLKADVDQSTHEQIHTPKKTTVHY